MKIKYIFYLILLLLSIPQVVYRFNHPEKTETQLLKNFFESYREFFSRFYMSAENDEMSKAIREAEILSEKTCESCDKQDQLTAQ